MNTKPIKLGIIASILWALSLTAFSHEGGNQQVPVPGSSQGSSGDSNDQAQDDRSEEGSRGTWRWIMQNIFRPGVSVEPRKD